MVLTCRSLLLALFLAVIPTAGASTTWYVDGVNGNDSNDCKSSTTACKTIGHAIALVSSGDTIMVAPATYTENLTISFSLKIIGSGASTTIVDGGGVYSVVTVIPTTTATVVLSGLTIRNGTGGQGGGISSSGTLTINNSSVSGNSGIQCTLFVGCSAGLGGGIYSSGTLTINNSTVSANEAFSGCFRLVCYAGLGGGIYSSGMLTINNSTISGNVADSGSAYSVADGGGIYSSSTLTINNSTISGNTAAGKLNFHSPSGGGIYSSSTLTINNSTISGNSAIFGGGISGQATVQNSIVANNTNGGNCSGTMTSKGYNLSSDGSCNFTGPADLNNTDPVLGPLQNNGGPTQTQALLSGSPAIDAGNPSGCTDGSGHLLKTDQRGKPRPDKEDTGGCDMGAYERQTD